MIRPTNDFIFVRLDQGPAFSPEGGIALVRLERPWSADPGREQKEGTVVAVGPGRRNRKGRRESMWGIEPGQRIAFSPNGNEAKIVDGDELVIIRRDSVIGISEEEHACT